MRAIVLISALLMLPLAAATPTLVVEERPADEGWSCMGSGMEYYEYDNDSYSYTWAYDGQCSYHGSSTTAAVMDDDAQLARAGTEDEGSNSVSYRRDTTGSRHDDSSESHDRSAWSSSDTWWSGAFAEAADHRVEAGQWCDGRSEGSGERHQTYDPDGYTTTSTDEYERHSACMNGVSVDGARVDGVKWECSDSSRDASSGAGGWEGGGASGTYADDSDCRNGVSDAPASYGGGCTRQGTTTDRWSDGFSAYGTQGTYDCRDGVFVDGGNGREAFVGSRRTGEEECAWFWSSGEAYGACEESWTSSSYGVGLRDAEGGSVWFPLP